MSDGMNCNGVIIPWTEYFFKGYSLEKVKAILTDSEIISRMESIYSRYMSESAIIEKNMSFESISYKSYEGHHYFFNTTHSTANINCAFVYEALNTGNDSKIRATNNDLRRAFDNDDSDDGEMFHRHIRKVISDWQIAKFSTSEHKALKKRIEDKITTLNQIGWAKIQAYKTSR